MKTFYGGTFMDKEVLSEVGIDYPIKLEYYKIGKEQNIENRRKEMYGIEVVKTEYKEEVAVEEESIDYMTENEEEVNHILDILKNHKVTPVIAKDVVEDLLKKE